MSVDLIPDEYIVKSSSGVVPRTLLVQCVNIQALLLNVVVAASQDFKSCLFVMYPGESEVFDSSFLEAMAGVQSFKTSFMAVLDDGVQKKWTPLDHVFGVIRTLLRNPPGPDRAGPSSSVVVSLISDEDEDEDPAFDPSLPSTSTPGRRKMGGRTPPSVKKPRTDAGTPVQQQRKGGVELEGTDAVDAVKRDVFVFFHFRL